MMNKEQKILPLEQSLANYSIILLNTNMNVFPRLKDTRLKWPPLPNPQKLLLFLRHLKYKYCEQISTKVHWSSNLWPYRHFWAKIRGQASEHDITLTANNHIFLDTILKRHWYLHQTKCNYLNEKQAHKTEDICLVQPNVQKMC